MKKKKKDKNYENSHCTTIPYPLKTIVTHIPLAARLMTMRHWKSDLSSNFSEMISIVQTHCTYELMLASSKGKYAQTPEFLQLWLSCYTTRLTL